MQEASRIGYELSSPEPYEFLTQIAARLEGVPYPYLLEGVRRPPDKHPLPALRLNPEDEREDGKWIRYKARESVVLQWLKEEEQL